MTSATYHFSALPPSSNNAYANNKKRGGRYRTKRYRTWSVVADADFEKQVRCAFDKRVAVRIWLGETGRTKTSDADNRIKAMLDFLVENGVIVNDNSQFVRRVTVGWTDQIQGCRVRITEVRR